MIAAARRLDHPASVLEAIAERQPQRTALVDGDIQRSWAELDDRSARFAAALTTAGVRRFAPVGLLLRNCAAFLEAHVGTLKARRVPINVNHRYLEDELALVLNDCGCEAVVVHGAFADVLAGAAPRVPTLRLIAVVADADSGTRPQGFADYEELLAAHEPAAPIERDPRDPGLFYTGGTTGTPRAVASAIGMRVSPAAVLLSARALDLPGPPQRYSPEVAQQLRDDGLDLRGLPLAPMMHGTGLNVLAMPTLLFGGCVVTTSSPRFEPDEVLHLMRGERVTTIAIAGDVMAKPLLAALEAGPAERDEASEPPALRSVLSAGMALGHETMRGLLRVLPGTALFEIFGATEAVMGTRTVRSPEALVSPVPTFDAVPGLKLLDADGVPIDAAPGASGLIAVPTADDKRYYGDPAKTAAVFRTIDGVRYAVPGDVGALEPDGRLRPIGRGSAVVNTGGEKVFPDEVENVLREVPGVLDCLVVGVAHPRWGQQVTAVASLQPGATVTEADLRAGVRAALADYKVPKRVLIVETVPRHANGKGDLDAVHCLLCQAGIGGQGET